MKDQLKNRRVLVLAEDLYEDLELWYPVLRLREEGAEVILAGTGAKTYHGKHGYPVTINTDAQTVYADNLDGIVIPGGYAPDRLRRDPAVVRLVREIFEQGKIIGAICHAGWVLISAGVLKGRCVTSFHAIKDDVINAGAEYRHAEVIRDKNLITSRQPSDLGAFCRTIIQALSQGNNRERRGETSRENRLRLLRPAFRCLRWPSRAEQGSPNQCTA